MSTRRFYRVEHSDDGRGAYRGISCAAYLAFERDRSYDEEVSCRHPCPNTDVGLYYWWERNHWTVTDMYCFGFESLNHYTNWFMYEEGRRAIAEEGWVVAVFDIEEDDSQLGQFQMIAKASQLVHVHDLDPYTLEVTDAYTEEQRYNRIRS